MHRDEFIRKLAEKVKEIDFGAQIADDSARMLPARLRSRAADAPESRTLNLPSVTLVKRDDLEVELSHKHAWPHGFAVELAVQARGGFATPWESWLFPGKAVLEREPALPRVHLAVILGEGTWSTNFSSHSTLQATRVRMSAAGAEGGMDSFKCGISVSPLPPFERYAFALEWPIRDVSLVIEVFRSRFLNVTCGK